MSSQAATEDKGEIIEEEKKELAPVSLAILHKIKTQQLQNGLRHGDYECYRKFCTLRARRIRKKLQFKHRAPKGTKVKRGEYFKRDIAEEEIDDARYVELFLVYAERAWALAMEKKSDDMPRSKFYSLRRLRKAAKWAKQLKELCERSAEEKTKLEAQSYAAWLQGLVFVEEENWKEALQQFHGAKTVYEQLSKVGSKEHKTLCLERADEIEPNIRFCVYNLKDEHQDESQIIDMLEQSEGNTLLMEKLSVRRNQLKDTFFVRRRNTLFIGSRF